MPGSNLARPGALFIHFVKSRKHAAVASAVAIALLGVGAVGAHDLRADTTTTDPTSNAGPKNIVQVKNFNDGTAKVEGRVQLGREPGPGIGAVNIAAGISSCTDCTTLAVALQINLFNRHASIMTPQNAAVAVNAGCTNCDTVAYAVQYNIGVDDPAQVPPRVNQLVAQMKSELAKAGAGNTSLRDAEAEINAVIADYNDLASSLTARRDEAVAPNSSPTTTSPSPSTASPNPADTPPPPSPDSTATPAVTPSASPSPSPAPASPSPSASAQPSRLST
jgi:hypothetical protein